MKRPGARLGQHFLANLHYARVLAEAVAPALGETILEIGPGKGALTKELLATGARVVAIEKDEALATLLIDSMHKDIAADRLHIVEGDVRDFDPKQFQLDRYVVAANIPYYITGEIIRQFLTAQVQPRAMALLIQKEVAERIMARTGKESILSISVKAYGVPRIVAKVGRGNFSPPPSVDSAILLIERISKDLFAYTSEQDFFKVVKAGFSSKRKVLVNNLSAAFDRNKVASAFSVCGLRLNTRAEDVRLEDWKRLTLALFQ